MSIKKLNKIKIEIKNTLHRPNKTCVAHRQEDYRPNQDTFGVKGAAIISRLTTAKHKIIQVNQDVWSSYPETTSVLLLQSMTYIILKFL